ncbi:MAG: ribosome small subunit-dependent GTPase A [Saprospiraceae bacterium]|nr:ribosome small subunit-dependent GTPase A [Saprospiraceae bacterium]
MPRRAVIRPNSIFVYMQEGTVIKTTGSWYDVRLDSGEILPCRMKGKFRLEGKSLTNPVAVGDRVRVEIEDGDAMIKEIGSRSNYVIRQSPRKKHDLHLIASNIDQAMVMVTINYPQLKQGFIDRFLLMTEPHDIPAHVIVNKVDLYNDQDIEIAEGLKFIYEHIGYPVHLVSSTEGTGIEAVRDVLKDKTTLIGGQSGVGKSTFINALQPHLELKTTDLSDYSGKGQHTTTFAEMFELDFGGFIIDMPGIKTLSFNNLEPMDVAHNFREFFAVSENCKYPDCLHRNEPGCAVKEGLESGALFELRYMNYLKILEEIEEQNYWERHSHF